MSPSPTNSRRLAPPYDAMLQPAKNWDLPTLTGAGGIRSTTNDLLKFVAASLAEDDEPHKGLQTLARETSHDGRRPSHRARLAHRP
ncbi:MAG: hypothetical protein R3C10_11760 [Pirellulales bacterium]